MDVMKTEVTAQIAGVNYTPLLCRGLKEYPLGDLELALSTSAAFILSIDQVTRFAVSWWVSPKRTRSYPYARVYDTLGVGERKVTVIPVLKDEGKEGDRDFIQWDTISLMSLLGVYVVISYYAHGEKSSRYTDKVTRQRFDAHHVAERLRTLRSYRSDALHWNMEEVQHIGELGTRALAAYSATSQILNVEMHREQEALERVAKLAESRETFMKLSRTLSRAAQQRESTTLQPKEAVAGDKGLVTITNYLGGVYYLTADEIGLEGDTVRLTEAKHTDRTRLPAIADIKDGLIKMCLFTSLEDVAVGKKHYRVKAVLKLTSSAGFDPTSLTARMRSTYDLLLQEAAINGFEVCHG